MPGDDLSTSSADVSASYEATRDLIKRVMGRVKVSCGQSDFRNAADKIGILMPGKFVMPADERQFRMVCDVTLFEANDRGVRPIDRFLAGPARALPEPERDIARRLGGAFFSLFKLTAVHESGGFWAENILDDGRRLWIVSTSLEDRHAGPEIYAMRLFEADQFLMPITVVLVAGSHFVRLCTMAKETTGRLPFSGSLAATVYGVHCLDGKPGHPSGIKFARALAEVVKATAALSSSREGAAAPGP